MTTFKNSAKYAELLFLYLDVANRDDCPFDVPTVLRTFEWNFHGGSLKDVTKGLRIPVETSDDTYPSGNTMDLARSWPEGKDCRALEKILKSRKAQGRLNSRSRLARVGTFSMLVSSFGKDLRRIRITTGLAAVYKVFSVVWEEAENGLAPLEWTQLEEYLKECMIAASVVSMVDVQTTDEIRGHFVSVVRRTRAPALVRAILDVKELIKAQGSKSVWSMAKAAGLQQAELMKEALMESTATVAEYGSTSRVGDLPELIDMGANTRFQRMRVGPVTLLVNQGVAMVGTGSRRLALGLSDMERLHQFLMSTVSALIGVAAQAVVGTAAQKKTASLAVRVAERNIGRIVATSKVVEVGDEVVVCKGYRRAYTAFLGKLAGEMCTKEFIGLVDEAKATAAVGVLDIDGFIADASELDAASALNACKMFKVCPAPDVSPGGAMIDRIIQIGNGNVMDPTMKGPFEEELRAQILRAHLMAHRGRLKLRDGVQAPIWWADYLKGNYGKIPSSEIHAVVAWEGTAEMPDVSPYDPANWKDASVGADTLREGMSDRPMRLKGNMMTRLVFDESCPMPGVKEFAEEHVIKFFTKAEGHKEPARGIFSSNLRDRFTQSWMEKAVESVAMKHPSFMLGQPVDVRTERTVQLITPPKKWGWIALYYSFDISGWSAKMPAEPQRISHAIWGELFDEDLFRGATKLNEGAVIYLTSDGYKGWFRNTHANLEGFNGKEMTMILVALLSLSVRRWRVKVVDSGVLTKEMAEKTSALLFAYIDDGLSRIDLPQESAVEAFEVYKETVIETFHRCGFSVEVTKCFPSDRFAIFLNEVYLAGRHVVHGVRAAMAISSEPTERHNTLVERISSVTTGVRGAVMAGLSPASAVILMSYHTFMHLLEWVKERDNVMLAAWTFTPRAWGGLGSPNMLQLYTSGSGSAFEEGIATIQAYARVNRSVRVCFLKMARMTLSERTATSVLTAPLSSRVDEGYMVDSRVAAMVRAALKVKMSEGKLSTYATRLLRYADPEAFRRYAEIIVPLGEPEVVQEQMLINMADAHPHSVFSAFARRLEKSNTVSSIIGHEMFVKMNLEARAETATAIDIFRTRFAG